MRMHHMMSSFEKLTSTFEKLTCTFSKGYLPYPPKWVLWPLLFISHTHTLLITLLLFKLLMQQINAMLKPNINLNINPIELRPVPGDSFCSIGPHLWQTARCKSTTWPLVRVRAILFPLCPHGFPLGSLVSSVLPSACKYVDWLL